MSNNDFAEITVSCSVQINVFFSFIQNWGKMLS